MDGQQQTSGQTPEQGYTTSSPCEPEGSGELNTEQAALHFSHLGDLSSTQINSGELISDKERYILAVSMILPQGVAILI